VTRRIALLVCTAEFYFNVGNPSAVSVTRRLMALQSPRTSTADIKWSPEKWMGVVWIWRLWEKRAGVVSDCYSLRVVHVAGFWLVNCVCVCVCMCLRACIDVLVVITCHNRAAFMIHCTGTLRCDDVDCVLCDMVTNHVWHYSKHDLGACGHHRDGCWRGMGFRWVSQLGGFFW
jgi:hypothetical protein